MSNNSNNFAIKRFTYDWFIRFVELHPIQSYDNQNGAYNPQHSTYASISPMFTTLITRYMPTLFYSNSVDNHEIQKLLAALKKQNTIIVVQHCYLNDPTSAMISEVEESRVFFHGKSLHIRYNPEPLTQNPIQPADLYNFLKFWKFVNYGFGLHTVTPDEFESLLYTNHYKRISIHGVLTVPIMFSEIWPQLLHYESIELNVNNLIYGENIAAVLREYRVLPKKCNLWMDLSDKAVLEVFKFLLSLTVSSTSFRLRFLESKSAMLRGTILNMHERTRPPHCIVHTCAGPFNEVILHFLPNGILNFHFAHKL